MAKKKKITKKKILSIAEQRRAAKLARWGSEPLDQTITLPLKVWEAAEEQAQAGGVSLSHLIAKLIIKAAR